MAQRVKVYLEDDVDGGDASETIRFGLDGVDYEIDLSADNASRLRDDFAQWVGHGRKLSRRKGGAKSVAGPSGSASATEIRAWAEANGVPVSARGRVPADVREAYDRAH